MTPFKKPNLNCLSHAPMAIWIDCMHGPEENVTNFIKQDTRANIGQKD